MIDWILNLLNAASEFLNVLIFNGDSNYSLSGDAYRYRRYKLMCFIDTIFFWQEEHCKNSYLMDVKRAEDFLEEHRSRVD